MGMECKIFMGKEDTERQALNVFRMELLGAEVEAVTSGTMTLKDAVNATMQEWAGRVEDTHYVLGSVMGPHPFPTIVRDFQKIIGKEIKEQMMEKEGRLPDAVIACVGGGSNAIGAFYEFIEDKGVRLIGCEAADLAQIPIKMRNHGQRNDRYFPRNEIRVLSGRIWTDCSGLFDFRGAGLSGHRTGTRDAGG